MKTKILSIFTRTSLHVGAGSSVGAIDMPVVRERHTRFPVIPGSSIKGVLADLFLENNQQTQDGKVIFGKDDCAGQVLFGEGKLLAFPVRSAKGCFAFITCPLALSRFAVDKNLQLNIPEITNASKVIVSDSSIVCINDKVILEEYPLDIIASGIDASIISELTKISNDSIWVNNLEKHLIIVSDELFSYFVENACEVANHNCIDDATGVANDGALFCQENIPSEAMFYTVLNGTTDEGLLDKIAAKLQENNNLIQIGANATTGLGWCSVKM